MALTNGQIAGICVGVILVVVFLICVPLYCYFVYKKRRREAGYESEEDGQPSTSPPPPSEKEGTENPGYEIGEEVNGAVNHGKNPDNGVVQTNGPVAVDVAESPTKIEIETPQKSVAEKPEEITLDIPEEESNASKAPDVRRDSDSLSRFSLNSDIDLDNISLKMRGLGDTDDILTSVMSVKSPFNFDEENVIKDTEVTPGGKDESNRMFDFDSLGKDAKLLENKEVPKVTPENSNIPEDRSKLYQVSDIPGNDLAPKENISFDLERSDSLSLSSASSKETIIEMPGYLQKDMSPNMEQNVFQGDTTLEEELTLSDLEEDLNTLESEQPTMESIKPHTVVQKAQISQVDVADEPEEETAEELNVAPDVAIQIEKAMEVNQPDLQRAQISQVEVTEKPEEKPEEDQVTKTKVEPEVEIQIEPKVEIQIDKPVEVDQSDLPPDGVIPNGHDVAPMTLGVEMISDSDSGSDAPTCSISMPAEDSSSTDASAGENDGTVSVQIPERISVSDDKVNDSDTFFSLDKPPPTIMGDSFEKSIFSTLDSSGVPKLNTEQPSLNGEPEVTVLSFRSKDGVDDDSVSISSASSGSSEGSKGDVLKESLAVEEPHSPPFSPITPLRKRFFSDTPEIGVPSTQVTSSPLHLEPETGEARTVTDTEPPWKSFDLSPTSKKEMSSELESVAKVDEVSSPVTIETLSEPEVVKIDEQFEEKALTFAKPEETYRITESASSESSSSESEKSNVDSDTSTQTASIETPLKTEKEEEVPVTPQKQVEPTVVQESKTFESILDSPSMQKKASEPTAVTPSVGIGGDPTDDVVSSVGSALTSWRTRKPWRTRGARFDDDSSSGRSTPESEKTKDASFFSSLLGSTKEDTIKGIRSDKKRTEVARSDSRTPRFKYKGFLKTYEDDEDEDRKGDSFSSPEAKTDIESQREESQEKSSSNEIEEKLSESSSFEAPARKTGQFNGPSVSTTAQKDQVTDTPPMRNIDDIIQHLNNRPDKQNSSVDQSPRPEHVPAASETPSRPPLPSPDQLTASQRQLAQQDSAPPAAPGRPPLPSTPNLSRTESYKALTPEQQSEIISAKSTPTSRTVKAEVENGTPKVTETTPKVAETPKVADTPPNIPDSTPRTPDTSAPKVAEVTPKVPVTTPKVPETTPKIQAETTPKVPDSTPKVSQTTPKTSEARKLPGRTRDKPTVSKLSPARLSPYTPMPFNRDRHTSPTSTTTPPSAGVAKGRRPRGVARFMNSSSNPLFHAAMLLTDEENKKNASPPAEQKMTENGGLRNGRSSSPSVKTSPAPQEQSSKPSTSPKTESEGVKAPPRRSRGSDPSTNGTSQQQPASALPKDGRKDLALLRTPSSVSRASEDGSEYGEAVSVALDDAFAMLDDI
ncbi:protein piccolo-like [Branchiostoma floridae]|uniref:Protein piccolo-like n=1 Tax=Branchiostoma floridae TaxID=7739 RepID=C3ZPV4_BRAFL|nr:protein piccolo-like [Branchiostoma floridae]|eukprot:XP_002589322.1 hypothetical protein BRAFLDRAFT_77775 [Branchiostoma floridae]